MAKAARAVNVPIFRIDPHRAFAEVPSAVQTTSDATRGVASMAILAAYLLSGTPLGGVASEMSIEEVYEELRNACLVYNVSLDYVISWAESLLIDPAATMSPEDAAKYVPTHLPALGWSLRPFQVAKAAWAAHRMGSILALGCGVGKSGTATAAAIAAAKSGRCSDSRCYIYCPVNAVPQWGPYMDELATVYKDVRTFSIDSAHNEAHQGIDSSLGGAVIFDEVHKLKSDTSRRGNACERLRHAFQWGVGLTGTLLTAGAEGVMRIQDLALPGLSRFLNKWAFGEVFDCIYTTEFETRGGRKQTKTNIGMPPESQQEAFTAYLARGVQSLSFTSPEVKDCLTMPDHSTIDVAEWAMPAWLLEQQGKILRADSRNRVYWAPESRSNAQAKDYLGALALAIRTEDPLLELPTWPRVMQAATKEGRLDRAIVKTYDNDIPAYKFLYEEGRNIDVNQPWTLPAGPKIRQAMSWLREHPKQQLVIAAVGTLSVLLMAQAMSDEDITFSVIDGTTAIKNRKTYVEDFQNSKTRVMLMQQAAGAESITLTRSSTSILLDHNWSAAVYTQFIHRTYRTGQTEDCEHYDYMFGLMQESVVRRLKRGLRFDQQIRQELESLYWDKADVEALVGRH